MELRGQDGVVATVSLDALAPDVRMRVFRETAAGLEPLSLWLNEDGLPRLAHGWQHTFSNHGPWVDALAPGVDIVSSYVRFRPLGRGVAAGTETREYGAATWSGTSFAAPRVAADLAQLLHTGMSIVDAWAEVCVR